MKLTDGKRTVKITMHTFDGTDLGPDWSQDFFEAGCLPYDDETDAYFVKDVDYCIDMAEDWKHGRGDFAEDDEVDPESRVMSVEEA